MKTLQGLLGYGFRSVEWGTLRVICEVNTGGEDADGFTRNETLGVGVSEFGNLTLFRASIDSVSSDRVSTISLSDVLEQRELPRILRELADELERVS